MQLLASIITDETIHLASENQGRHCIIEERIGRLKEREVILHLTRAKCLGQSDINQKNKFSRKGKRVSTERDWKRVLRMLLS